MSDKAKTQTWFKLEVCAVNHCAILMSTHLSWTCLPRILSEQNYWEVRNNSSNSTSFQIYKLLHWTHLWMKWPGDICKADWNAAGTSLYCLDGPQGKETTEQVHSGWWEQRRLSHELVMDVSWRSLGRSWLCYGRGDNVYPNQRLGCF